MFESSEYAWKDIEIVMLGRPVIRITEVQYEESQKLEEIYGRGQKPLAIQEGNYGFKGQITLGQSEVIALENLAKEMGLSSILKLKFDLNVAYSLDNIVRRDVCKKCRIEKKAKGMKQGDVAMDVQLPFKFLELQEGV